MLDRLTVAQVVQAVAARALLPGPQVREGLHPLLVRVTLVALGSLVLPPHQTGVAAVALESLAVLQLQ
jgi:hypothetical protein